MPDAQHYGRLGAGVDEAAVRRILRVEFEQLELSAGADLRNSDANSALLVRVYERFWHELSHKSDAARHTCNEWLDEAVENALANVRYHFFATDGPHWQRVSVADKTPLVPTYFYFPFEDASVERDEAIAFDELDGQRVQAHNGWVMGDDPLKNFAEQGTQVSVQLLHMILTAKNPQ